MSLSSEKTETALEARAPSCDDGLRSFLADRKRCLEERTDRLVMPSMAHG
jgi:hypothetical protein